MESFKLFCLVLFIIGVVWFVVRKDLNLQKAKQGLNEEDIAKLREACDLFDGVPLHAGNAWKTLSVNELVKILVAAAEIIDRNGGRTFENAIREYAENCEGLSVWMLNNRNHPTYKDSDMEYLIEKPFEVSRKIEATYL